jgi:hypothetical protein
MKGEGKGGARLGETRSTIIPLCGPTRECVTPTRLDSAPSTPAHALEYTCVQTHTRSTLVTEAHPASPRSRAAAAMNEQEFALKKAYVTRACTSGELYMQRESTFQHAMCT